MIIALTGHRSEDCRSEADVRGRIRSALASAPEPVEGVITGMANGVDLWGGDEALGLGIPLWVARPWTTHDPRKSDKELYLKLVTQCSKYHVVTSTPTYPGPWVYQVRNEWMVDNATHVLAYYNGAPKGGTFNCLDYAKKVLPEDKIRNIYNG